MQSTYDKAKLLELKILDDASIWRLSFRYPKKSLKHFDFYKEENGNLIMYSSKYLAERSIKELMYREKERSFNTFRTRLKLYRFRIEMFLYKYLGKKERNN